MTLINGEGGFFLRFYKRVGESVSNKWVGVNTECVLNKWLGVNMN